MALSRAGEVDHTTIGNDRQRGKASSEHRRHEHPNGTALETQEANQNRLKRGTDTFTAMVQTLTLSSLLVDHCTKNIRK